MLKKLATMALLFSFVGAAGAQFADGAAGRSSPTLDLPPKLREALIAEMRGLREGLADIAVKLASGEWEAVADRADRMRASFIMQQKLSREELARLEHTLPGEFLWLDGKFHRHSGGLAEAARDGDAELATFYLYKMTDGCIACHARYATHTFKGFAGAKADPAHSH